MSAHAGATGTTQAERYLADEAATQALGAALAAAWPRPLCGVVWLQGALGSGKSTLARAFLRALGVEGAVRSPTYTLVEPYETAHGTVLHMDCYRLADAEELEFLGLRDTPPESALWLIEWPERVAGGLPVPDLLIALATRCEGREATFSGRDPGMLRRILQSVSQY